MKNLQKGFLISLFLVLFVFIVIGSVYVYIKKNPSRITNDKKIEFTMSGGYSGGTCVLMKKDPLKNLPGDAKQYICDANSVEPYQFYRYLYPTGGIYVSRVPDGDAFSKKIDAYYFVDEHFVDTREEKIPGHEWLDIGCYYPESYKLCNMPIKVFIKGTSTYQVIPNI
jgi:hypothetical protein